MRSASLRRTKDDAHLESDYEYLHDDVLEETKGELDEHALLLGSLRGEISVMHWSNHFATRNEILRDLLRRTPFKLLRVLTSLELSVVLKFRGNVLRLRVCFIILKYLYT